ncbi:hypothetical protein DGI_1306 [Megalodesulfovibrio gigas DSM 1382 = ATCC 19364]|uniref:Uncharacterized protein n=1 Tax=Megalodesulfovibrio gigas (strain ATCC 19364 / DSM 1382 / NCIMB 9332 / VKM B-1759) TaxID=1121448 RepID=T2GB84_MEGG1|nr:hypothetical protein DGI_1306 [Megalodesulfovibrio gigas DSM 1382 = ATCC 19364]
MYAMIILVLVALNLALAAQRPECDVWAAELGLV